MNVLELFSCSGGMAEGLRRAGLHVTMAIDHDADACESYERNLGHRPVQLGATDLLRMVRAGWSPGAIELFVADPPCTPWSRAGKRLGVADKRDMLEVTVELVRLLDPRAWLIANVPGLDDAPNWPVVQRTIGSLGDRWCIDFARFDAANYGVPQHRVRPFWYGHSQDQPHIAWPAPTHGAPTRELALDGCALLPWVTCRQALEHLPAAQLGTPVRLRWRAEGKGVAPRSATHVDEPATTVTGRRAGGDSTIFDGPNHRPSRADAPARTVTRNTHSDGALLTNSRHPVNSLDAPSYTVTTKGDGRGAQGACVLATHDGHPISRADEPAHVVPSSQPGNGGAVLEWQWDVPSTYRHAARRIGGAWASHRLEHEHVQRGQAQRDSRCDPARLPSGLALRGRDQEGALVSDRAGDAAAARRGGRAVGCAVDDGREGCGRMKGMAG